MDRISNYNETCGGAPSRTKKRYFEDAEADLDFIPVPNPPNQHAQVPDVGNEESDFSQRVAELCSANKMLINSLQKIAELESRVRELTVCNYALQIDNFRLERDAKIQQEKIETYTRRGAASPYKSRLEEARRDADVSDHPRKMFYACRNCRENPVINTDFVFCDRKCSDVWVCAKAGCGGRPRGSGLRRDHNEYSTFCYEHAKNGPIFVDEKVVFEWRNDKWSRVRQ